jgi:hypothetical protein
MSSEEFRRIALSMDGASEGAHMGHPDFRVGGRIFATLGYPNERFGVVMLEREEQAQVVRAHPAVFAPANGAWGERGSTVVTLAAADAGMLRKVIRAAWRKRAPNGGQA